MEKHNLWLCSGLLKESPQCQRGTLGNPELNVSLAVFCLGYKIPKDTTTSTTRMDKNDPWNKNTEAVIKKNLEDHPEL